jgi:hypothetical protein
MPNDTLGVALDCLKQHPNWYLFPIRPLYKSPPCFDNNLELASNDPAQIRRWRAQNFGCNWGVALKKSKLICVDVDRKPGKVGGESLDALELERGILPDTLTVLSPSGGLHLYFDEANGVVHQMRLNAFGQDIDSTNYTLIPGCETVEDTGARQSAGTYKVVNSARVAPAPKWFAEYLGDETSAVKPDADQAPAVEQDTDDIVSRAIYYLKNDAKPSIQGQNGEFTLLMVFATLKDMGLSRETAVELVVENYNDRCEPPWEVGEGAIADRLDAKATNAWSYLKNTQPGALSPQAEFGAPAAKLDEDDIATTLAVYIANPGLPVKSNLDDAVVAASKNARAEAAAMDTEVKDDIEDDPMFATDEPEDVGAEEVKPAVEPAQNLKLPGLDKINWKAKPTDIKEVCQRWVWIAQLKRFVNRLDPTQQWDVAQFDSMFNNFLGKPTGSISKELFKEGSVLRRYHYIAFRPGAKETAGVEYNVWRPSPIQPVAGDTSVWNEHINYLFQDETKAKHVLDWMAWVLQNPARKPNHALLIVGKNTGTGKSLIATIFEQLIGVKNTQRPKNSSMGGDFNAWLRDCRLCIIEEVYQVGRRENLNAMRDILTEARVEVNIKGISAFTIENFVAVMGVSNHPDALPLDKYDRRWLVVETLESRKDRDYYEPLFKMARGIDTASLSAIYAELLARDLQGYSGLDAAPETTARAQMIELSRDDAETWLLENAGNMPLARNVVQVSDIVNAMPATLQRTKRLSTTTIPNFLKDNLDGVRHPQQVWLSNGTKVRLWVLHGRYSMIPPDKLGKVYEAELKKDRVTADTSAKADFEEGYEESE